MSLELIAVAFNFRDDICGHHRTPIISLKLAKSHLASQLTCT